MYDNGERSNSLSNDIYIPNVERNGYIKLCYINDYNGISFNILNNFDLYIYICYVLDIY